MFKSCPRCKRNLPVGDFHNSQVRKGGLSYWCKKCDSECGRERYRENTDKVKSKNRKWVKENREKVKDINRRWYKANKKKADASSRKWKKENPLKVNTHNIVKRAIKRGDLIKAPCEICGEEERISAHHDDYDKPLSVRWLCQRHHSQLHADLKRNQIKENEHAEL